MKQTGSPGALLEDAIRRIVREEVRAALAERRTTQAHAPSPQAATGARRGVLTAAEVALKTGVAVQTLANWRTLRNRSEVIGPKPFKVGRLVRYFEADVDAWIAQQANAST